MGPIDQEIIEPAARPMRGRPPTARDALRIATSEVHEALDARLSDSALGGRTAYARFLRMQAQALPALERALAAGGFGALCPGWGATQRADLLTADLAGLGLEIPTAPRVVPVTGARAWGVAYVLEGSRLGGRVLERRARAGGDRTVLSNLRFLSHRTVLTWARFLDAMEAALPGPGERDRAAEGAQTAFALYTQALDISSAGAPGRAIR